MRIEELTNNPEIIAYHKELHRRYMLICNAKRNLVKQVQGLERKNALLKNGTNDKDKYIRELESCQGRQVNYELSTIPLGIMSIMG